MDENHVNKWEKECLSKKRIQTEDYAKKVVELKPYLDYYRCPSCGFWHMTHLKSHHSRYKKLKIV